jgi:hypothetical protein
MDLTSTGIWPRETTDFAEFDQPSWVPWRRENAMTLIKCTECGGEISDKAVACTHCGWAYRQSYSTGPRTEEGKARSANNGRYAQKGDKSVRQIQAGVADIQRMIREMFACRKMLESGG